MTVTLADLSDRTGLAVLDHLEREVTVPVINGPQAQGDLIVIPHHLVADEALLAHTTWTEVPAEGIELLRGATGGNPHTLVADPGTCQWTDDFWDSAMLAIGALRATAPVYLLHPEHGATGLTPGTYLIRRQREFDHRSRRQRIVAD
ncbi:hypothetical protein [Nonomuraea sp. NPDC046570]|uniref:hypothetical protein n=1 Tax=Nonomuraea sp. NPDC046570 TaxID=3155255 RepID=UPI00340B6B5A